MNEKTIQDAGLIQQENSGRISDIDRASPQHNKSSGTIKYFSMFTGVGGFEKGIERASNKFQCVGFSEIDKHSSKLLADKFPEIKNYGDATKINPHKLPDFELLVGGFPCQSFSIAGKRRGFADERGSMFGEICRIIEVKKPKFLFLENVKGLLSAQLVNEQSKNIGWTKGFCFAHILQRLDELGYNVQWFVLNSKFFGVPQNRERVFIIGSVRGEPIPKILPFNETKPKTFQGEQLCKQVSNCIRSNYSNGYSSETYVGEPIKNRNQQELIQIGQIGEKNSMGQRVYDKEEIATSIRSSGGGQGAKTGLYYVPYQNMLNIKTRDVEEALFVGKIIASQENKAVQLDLMHLQHGEIRPLSTYIPQNLDEHRCLQGGEPKEVLIEPSMKIRRLTPTECEFLQSFPKGWTTQGIQSFINLDTYYKVNGTTKKTDSIKILSLLQEAVGEKEGEGWGFNEFVSLLKDEILQPRLYEESIQIEMARGQCIGTRRELQSKAVNYCNRMFSMWQERKVGYTPQRQEQIKQLFGKLTSALQKLPYQVASQGRWMEQDKFNEQEKKFFGQIHTLVEFSDTQRYKMMGNAVTVNVIKAIAEKLAQEVLT